MTEAAFKAVYADFKIVKTRSVVQIILELPIEGGDAALEALGGLPRPDREVWMGVARLGVTRASDAPKQLEKPPARDWKDLPPATQAGIMCGDAIFWEFLRIDGWSVFSNLEAAAVMREMLHVRSRADIKADDPAWTNLLKRWDDYKNKGDR